MRVFRRYAGRYSWAYALGALCLLITNYLAVTIPVEIGAALDALRADGPVQSHVWAILVMGLAVIVVRTLSRVLFFNPGRYVEYDMRQDLFGHLLRLRPGFYATQSTGDVVSRASNDLSFARVLIGFGLLQAFNATLSLTLTGWRLFTISAQLTVYVLLPLVVLFVLVQASIRWMFELQRAQQEQLGAISDQVLGSFQGVATIQGFVAEDAFERRFTERNQAWFRTSMKLALLGAGALPLIVLGGGLGVFSLLYVGGPMAIEGETTVGDLAAVAALLGALLPTLRSMGWLLSLIQRGRASLGRIFELLDAPVLRPEQDAGLVPPAGIGPAISVRGLSFAYPDAPDTEVLHDLHFEVPAGALVGVFGRTGSGKSTLMRVLSRLYDPGPGQVMLGQADGETDLLAYDLAAWHRSLAVAPQRPFLFSDTIAANVALGPHPPDHERVAQAVELAALGPDLASLPDGLATVVGERGIMLSGGQRQRSALARALYRRAGLVLLDDVLSAVDHETEARLVETIRQEGAQGGGPTTLVVSHRMSALAGCDVVLVLEEGRLVDQGTHEALISRPGVYQDVWKVQEQEAAP